MIKCFHGYLTLEESSTFIFHSDMKGHKNFTVGNTMFHVGMNDNITIIS